jgi:hypothetical protein
VDRRRRKGVRLREQRRRDVEAAELREAASAFIPVEPELSQTQAKKNEREQRTIKERAERRLKRLDEIWGIGLGPVKARLKWMTQLFQ